MIDAVLIGRDELGKFLAGIPDSVERELRVEVETLSIKLLRKVKEKLSGEVLGNVTGTLRASVNYKVKTEGRAITGTVGTNKEYAAVHEYGIDRVVNVSAYLRQRVAAHNAHIVGPVKPGAIKKAQKKFIGPQQGPIQVKAHTMHMKMPKRSYLRSSLKEMETEIKTRLEEAAQRGANAQ